VEDQSTDSSDLTDDAATASVPQGKAARSRHRLPRQKAQQIGQPDEVVADDEPTAEAVEPTEPSAETSDTAVVDEPKRRRRMSWRRAQPEAPEEPTEPVVLVPHRTAGRALKIAAVAAGVLFIGAAAFAGATIQPYLADRAAVHTKFVIAETAASAITTLWTYTPDDMDKLPDRSAKYLGGDFAADYKRYIDAIVAPNKQAQVTNNTQVLGAAVESLTPAEATAIVYTNSVATSPVTKGIPSLRYLSYRLTMKPQGNRWLITQMVAVTKLDLTPRL
jgi:Mce-associated membrane protein